MKMKKPIALLCATIMLMSSMTVFAAETPQSTTITQAPESPKTAKCTVTANGPASNYSVTVPSTITLNRDDASGIVTGKHDFTVTGDIAGNEKVSITVKDKSNGKSDGSFTMKQVGKTDVTYANALCFKKTDDNFFKDESSNNIENKCVATWDAGSSANVGDADLGTGIRLNINMSDTLETVAGTWTGELTFDIALVTPSAP